MSSSSDRPDPLPPGWASDLLSTAMAEASSIAPLAGAWHGHACQWTRLGNGIVTIVPDGAGDRSIVISAAVHGNETGPAEMLDAIVADLALGALPLTQRLLVIIGNPPAIVAGTRFVEENLNRLFSGRHAGRDHAEARRAAELEAAVTGFFATAPAGHRRIHYELHTAIRASELVRFVVHPYGQDLADDQLDFLRRADIDAVLLADKPASTFSYFSSNTCDAESMTIELGRVAPLGQNDPSRLAAIDACLRSVLAGTPLPPIRSNPQIFRVEHELLRTDETDFALHVADDVANFTLIDPGYRITSDRTGGIVVHGAGRRIVFPNPDVPVGQRVGLVVAPVE